jgi:hypothetical protein
MQEDCNTQLGEATQVAVEEAVGEAEEANRVATEKADEARTKAEAARKAAETADTHRSSYEFHRTAHLTWKGHLTADAEDANTKAGDADTAADDADTAAETAAGLNKKIVPAEVVTAATIAYGDATAAAKEARAAAEQARIAAEKATTAAGEAQAALDAPAEIVLPFCQGNGRAGTGVPPNCRDWANDKVTMSTKWPSMALGSCASPQGEDVQRCNHMAEAGEIPDMQTTANVSCPAFMSEFYEDDYVRYKCRYQPGTRTVWRGMTKDEKIYNRDVDRDDGTKGGSVSVTETWGDALDGGGMATNTPENYNNYCILQACGVHSLTMGCPVGFTDEDIVHTADGPVCSEDAKVVVQPAMNCELRNVSGSYEWEGVMSTWEKQCYAIEE